MRYWKKNPKYGQVSCGGNMFSSGTVIEGHHWAQYATPPDDRLIECDASGNPLSAPPPLPVPVLHAPVPSAPVPGPAEGMISSVASPASQPAPPAPAPAMSPAPEPPQVLGVGDGLQSETTEAVEVPLHTIAPEAPKAEGKKPSKEGQPEPEGSVAGTEAKAPPVAPGEALGGKKEASKPSKPGQKPEKPEKPGTKPVQVAKNTTGKKGGRGTAYV